MFRLSEFNKLKEEFDLKVAELQRTCVHEPGEWKDIYDHHPSFTGTQMRFCTKCRLRLDERKTPSGYITDNSRRAEVARLEAKLSS